MIVSKCVISFSGDPSSNGWRIATLICSLWVLTFFFIIYLLKKKSKLKDHKALMVTYVVLSVLILIVCTVRVIELERFYGWLYAMWGSYLFLVGVHAKNRKLRNAK